MKAKWILATFFVVASAALAHAGGPPPMYVVVDKVVFDQNTKTSGTVQIWGSFTRTEKTIDKAGKESWAYTKPAYGFVYLSLTDTNDKVLKEELQEWQRAAGTGKAVAVGSCGDAGCMLKTPIHHTNETVTKPDAAYTTKYLKLFGDLYANEHLSKQPEVAALLKYAKDRK